MKTSKRLERFNVDYVCVDEISMVKEVFYNFLIMTKKKKPNIKLIVVGDFNQLKPVNDRVNVNFKFSLALHELCSGNHLELTTCSMQMLR